MSCPAVRCRAVPCFAVLSLPYIQDDNASKHTSTELARASMTSSILYSSAEPSFSIFLNTVPVYSNSSTAVVCTSMLSLNREHSQAQHSTAQHSTITPAQSSKPSTYIACCVRFVFLEHTSRALGIRKSTFYIRKMLDHLLHLSVIRNHSSL